VVIGVGIALSGYVHLGLALGLVVLYLALSINVYLESEVFGRFQLGYSRMGPTEARILLIGLNAGLALYREVPAGVWPELRVIANVAAGLLAAAFAAVLIARFVRNVYVLARLEPQVRPKR
jgi:hypothetical protein